MRISDWSSDVCSSDLPFDEIGIEEAIRLREKGVATEVIAVSVGPQKAQETLRTALAMGADRAILVQTDDAVEPLALAKIFKAIARSEEHTSELQSLMRISYAVFCLKKKIQTTFKQTIDTLPRLVKKHTSHGVPH